MSNDCHRILVPSEEISKKDYSVVQAYAYLNAAKDYAVLKNSNGTDQSLGAAYAGFSVDLSNSNSAEEFQQRVRERLISVNFTMKQSDAESHLKRGLTDKQVEAWADCMNGAVLKLHSPDISEKFASVHLHYRSALGVENHPLTLTIVGGSINGKTKVLKELTGNDSEVFLVKRSANENVAFISAEVRGQTDSLKLDFTHNGLLDTITIARRSPYSSTPYMNWTPHTVQATAMAAPVRWIAQGEEYLNLVVKKDSVVFKIAHESLYANPGAAPFDGFVLSGFNRPIKKVRVTNQSTPLIIKATLTQDNEVEVDLRGLSPADTGFDLEFEFDK